jgi:hypothetical protein
VNIRLLSIAPPEALRPHFQEGYLGATDDIMGDYVSKDELDFNRRLIAKFRIPSAGPFWGTAFSRIPHKVLFPDGDRVRGVCREIQLDLQRGLLPGEMGNFMVAWNSLERWILDNAEARGAKLRSFSEALRTLWQAQAIDRNELYRIDDLRRFRNLVVHRGRDVGPTDAAHRTAEAKQLLTQLRQQAK